MHALLVTALLFTLTPDAGPVADAGAAAEGARDAGQAASDETIRLRATGDVMLGSSFPEGNLPPNDGKDQLATVADLMRDADFTFVNLEGSLCDHGETKKCGKHPKPGSCFAFRVPTHYGQYLKDAGVDVVSTANNHSGDFGEECRRECEQTLDALGIAWSGPPGSIAELNVKGKKIALIAFHTSAGTNNVNDHEAAAALVKKAKAGHDLVIVSMHGGAEGSKALHVPHGKEIFFGENRGDLRAFTHAVVDAGADLVLGHGPHVARGMELYKGHLIAYSMGNFATYGQFTLSGAQGLGMVLEVTLGEGGKFEKGRIFATRQLGKGTPEPDPSGAVIKQVQGLAKEDFPDTRPEIKDDGTILPRG